MNSLKFKETKKSISKNNNVKNKEVNVKHEALILALKSNIIFIIGIVLLTCKSILLNQSLELGLKGNVVIYMISVGALLMCPTINRRDKFSYIYFNIVYAIVTLIIYCNYLYYSYSTNFLSIYQISNLQYAKEIGGGLFVLINIKNILAFWTANVLAAVLSIVMYKKTKKIHYEKRWCKFVIIFLIILANVCNVRNSVNGIYEEKIYNKSLIIQEISVYYYHYEDIKDYVKSLFIKEDIDTEKLEKIYNTNLQDKAKESQYTGIAKNKNVIVLQLESLNEYIIDKSVNGKEITPNLNKFYRENIYCEDMYNQGLGTTADSEFEMENSLYPLENGYVFQKYYDNKWFDIYSTLKQHGYYTSFMHPNTSTFWNRHEVYNTGYNIDEYDDINEFPNIESAGEFYSDEGFLQEAVKKMNSYEGNFCTTLVSVTTHIPFFLTGVSDLENKLTLTEDDVKGYEDDIFRNYILSCNFVDYAFGKFIKELEDTGLMDDSILVVYGDHGSGLSNTEELQKLYEENGQSYNEYEQTTKDVHVPFGISIPNLKDSMSIKRTVSKIDIKPTILDLLGVQDNFSLGETIFSNKDYSFIKGIGYVTSEDYCFNDIRYKRTSMQEIEKDDKANALIEKMENEMYLSDTIIKNNLIK